MYPSQPVLRDVELVGKYSNYFQVGHNNVEFIIDFGQLYEASGQAGIHTRIVTSPVYVALLLNTLASAIAQHERMHGAIQRP
jgi:hypothetical protein